MIFAVDSFWRRRALHLGAFFALLAATLGANGAFPVADTKWYHYTSANFTLHSRVTENRSRELLQKLELMRAVFFQHLRWEAREPVPLTIVYFDRTEEMASYVPPQISVTPVVVTGYYHPLADRDLLLLAAEPNHREAMRNLFVGYAHHLFRVTGERAPWWFRTGFAEIFSSLTLEGGDVVIGRADRKRLGRMFGGQTKPVSALLRPSQIFIQDALSQAQAWALVHYLYFGDSGVSREKVEQFVRYTRDYAARFDAAELESVFADCFGLDFSGMDARLKKYLQDGRYQYTKIPAPTPPSLQSFQRRAMSAIEAHELLEEVALRTVKSGTGRLGLLEKAGRSDAPPRVFETLGAIAFEEGNQHGARTRWQEALARGSTNPAVYHHLGVIGAQGYFREFSYHFRLSEEKTTELRSLLKRSIEITPQQASAYEMLAWVEAAAPEISVANVNLVQRQFSQLVDQPRTMLALAVVRARLGKKDEALELLKELEEARPGPELMLCVEDVRRQLGVKPTAVEPPRKVRNLRL